MTEKLEIMILGCGYTGRRVAKRFLASGAKVTATTRNPQRLAALGAEIISTNDLPKHVRPGMLVRHSIPPDGPAGLLDPLDEPSSLKRIAAAGRDRKLSLDRDRKQRVPEMLATVKDWASKR